MSDIKILYMAVSLPVFIYIFLFVVFIHLFLLSSPLPCTLNLPPIAYAERVTLLSYTVLPAGRYTVLLLMLTTSFSIGFGDKLPGLGVEATTLGVLDEVLAEPLSGGEEEGEPIAEAEALPFVPGSALGATVVVVDMAPADEASLVHSSVFSFRRYPETHLQLPSRLFSPKGTHSSFFRHILRPTSHLLSRTVGLLVGIVSSLMFGASPSPSLLVSMCVLLSLEIKE